MDKNYWNQYYKKDKAPQEASLFAKYIFNNHCKINSKIIELGCGNGRDVVYFAENKLQATAIDQSDVAINKLKSNFNSFSNLKFLVDDFTMLNDFEDSYDIVYSRFTMHSITEDQENNVITWAYNNLVINGLFCIEARGLKNELYQKGTPSEQRNTYFYDEHFRRFICIDEFTSKLMKLGFEIITSLEERGFSPFNGNDETFIRVVVKK
jgi:ubiquinone/menaquinone biosynthesis C-methylase UbiE